VITVNIHEAKTRLSALIRKIEEDNELVLICRAGKPVAELQRPKVRKAVDPLKMHPELKGKILYDPTEALAEKDWPEGNR
jgi:antitoxin (DNA-binding transcriptional repressor) of toxin-antitoxin stability system